METETKTDSESTEARPSVPEEKRLSFWWVLGIVFGLSCILGVIAHNSLTHSVTSIKSSLVKMKKKGANMTVEQCAGHVLNWVKTCGAMQSLCDASVHRLMGKCLEGRSRGQVCKSIELKSSKAHFTFARCKKRKLHRGRRWKKICGGVYSTVWIHCMYWRKGKIKAPHIKKPVRSRPKPNNTHASPKARKTQ